MKQRRWIVTAAALVLMAVPVWSQEPGDPETDGGPWGEELQRRVHEHYQRLLRVELGLSDAQTRSIMPVVERLERHNREIARQRRELRRGLTRAYQSGAADADLQNALERMTQLELDSIQRKLELQAEIDTQLSVRQRVKFRLVSQHFREEVRRRVQEARSEQRMRHPSRRPGRR